MVFTPKKLKKTNYGNDREKVQQVEIINNSEVKVYINKKYANDPEYQ